MMDAIATCEWNPGMNRSVVSIETAAKNVPLEDRSLLIAKFNKKNFDDLVEIKRSHISGQKKQYGSSITNMNFSSNRLCRNITRKNWKLTDVVSAMVFEINGRSYGYASVCGNLFSLTSTGDRETPPVPPVISPPIDIPQQKEINGSESSTPSFISNASFAATCECSIESGQGIYSGGFIPFGGSGGGYIGTSNYGTPGTIPPVPELQDWLYIAFGLVGLSIFKRRKKQ